MNIKHLQQDEDRISKAILVLLWGGEKHSITRACLSLCRGGLIWHYLVDSHCNDERLELIAEGNN